MTLLVANEAAAQGWTADLYAGGTRAQGVAAAVTSTSLVGNLRYQDLRGSLLYGALGAPVDDAGAFWGAAGASSRTQWRLGAPLTYGIEPALDGFVYRDRVTATNGSGLTLHTLGFVNLALPTTAAAAALELRGGIRGRMGDASVHVWEVGGRGSVSRSDFVALGDVRWLRSDTSSYPFAGAQLLRAFSRGRVWASAGRWLGDLEQTAWELGGSVAAGGWGELWASVRQDATDPLYGNASRRSWNVGFSRALGRRPGTLPAPEIVARGRVRIRLPERSVPGPASAVRVAGEFNGWMPAPMTRSGSDWVLELPLASGVYRFAFVSASGEWFVPEGYPGRMSDDKGGHVAVLVVP
jgi:hypothetical protein